MGWQMAGVRGPSSSSHLHFVLLCLLQRARFLHISMFLTKFPVFLTIEILIYTSHILELIHFLACSWKQIFYLQIHKSQLFSPWPLGNLAGSSPQQRFMSCSYEGRELAWPLGSPCLPLCQKPHNGLGHAPTLRSECPVVAT